jgi:hypothetical protein
MIVYQKGVLKMRNIPMFATENGVASLVLEEIPTQGCAYIHMQSAMEPKKLLDECIGFCRMVGAKQIYAKGDPMLEEFPFHTAIWEMRCAKESLGDTDAALWPVQAETTEKFREIYNRKIRQVPNAAWMSEKEAKRVAACGEGYYIHRGSELLGIGMIAGNEIRFVASLFPGAGAEIVCALAHGISDDVIVLEVASQNQKAVSLYESLGFVKSKEISLWYCVFEETVP